MTDSHALVDHEHAAKHDGTGADYSLYEAGPNTGKWGTAYTEGHSHDEYSRLDLVHDHGRGFHHHHIAVIDNFAGLLYWSPAHHLDTWPVSPGNYEGWVAEFLDELPAVIREDSLDHQP